MEQIVEDVQNRLIQKVSELKYVDEDWGQMDSPNPPVKYPCSLIDIQGAEYTDEGNLIQQGTVMVVIKLYLLKLSNSSNAAPQSQKDKYKKNWLLMKNVNKAIHGQNFLQLGHGLLMRKRFRKIKRDDGIIGFEIYYEIQFKDTTCVPVPVTTTVRPLVTVSVAKV